MSAGVRTPRLPAPLLAGVKFGYVDSDGTQEGPAHAMRARWLAFTAVLLASCSQAARPDDSGAVQDVVLDAPGADAPPDAASSAGFACTTGVQTWMEINGVVSQTAAVSATPQFLNCCEAATIQFVSARFTDSLTVLWRVQAGPTLQLPATVDLAHLPPAWSVTVFAGCAPGTPGCMPSDQFTDGLTGTLTVDRDGMGYRSNVCLTFAETAANPHTAIHSMRLASGDVTTH
jgi:hypothetical protein